MKIPISLRNELYALFKLTLQYPERGLAFDWLALWLRVCKLHKTQRIPLFEMITAGKLGLRLDTQALLELFGDTKILRLTPAPNDAPGYLVDLGDEEDAYPFMEDRVPRYHEVLRRCPGISSVADPQERDMHVAQLLFNHGLFFDCHEFLEEAWSRAEGPDREFLQGIIQAGAAFHKLEMGSRPGCIELLKKAIDKLTVFDAQNGKEENFRDFAHVLSETVDQLNRGLFDLKQAPKMRIA